MRRNLYNNFEKAFNDVNYTALYDMFGSSAKAQFTKETADTEFKKLQKYFKSVKDGTYTYTELAGTQGNTKIYNVYYAVSFPEPDALAKSGKLKITLAVQAQDWQIYGIRLDTI